MPADEIAGNLIIIRKGIQKLEKSSLKNVFKQETNYYFLLI